MTAFFATLDARLFFALYAAKGGAFAPAAQVFSAIGNGWMMLGLVPLLTVRSYRRFTLALAVTLGGSAALVFVLKALVGRRRPCVDLPGVTALCAMPSDPSFPSGHACGSFTLAAFVIVAVYAGATSVRAAGARPALAAGLLLVATGVAWSRVYLGVHFPGDVTAGALLGCLAGGLGGFIYAQRARATG